MSSSELITVLQKLRVFATSKPAPLPKHLAHNISHGGSSWHVTLRKGKKSLSTPFFMGSAHKGAPVLADVVHSLVTDAGSAGMTFEDFAAEFGYDLDDCQDERGRLSRTCPAYMTWRQIETQAPKVRAFFGGDLEKVLEAAQDY